MAIDIRHFATQTYNGWSNWETWNVSLWINNDEGLYEAAKGCNDYGQLREILWEAGCKETPDGCKWDDPNINVREINDLILEIE